MLSQFKDGKLLDSSSVISHRGNRHMLRIPSVDESNFGEYSCQAHNQFGSDQKTTVVSGESVDGTNILKCKSEGELIRNYP